MKISKKKKKKAHKKLKNNRVSPALHNLIEHSVPRCEGTGQHICNPIDKKVKLLHRGLVRCYGVSSSTFHNSTA